jgi:hypothetical protein
VEVLLKSWLLLALICPAFAHAGEPIEFRYTNADVLAAPDSDSATIGKAWFERCAAGGEFARLAASYAPDPHMTRDEREAAAKKFDSIRFEAIAQDAYDKVVGELPQGKLTLCVDFTRPGDTFARDQMHGVMAFTAGSGKIIVKLHPDADWASLLPYVLAHEMNHSYWAKNQFDPKAGFTLGDYLVFEGRADNFAMHLFGQHPAPWIDALSDAQYQATLVAFAPHYGDRSPEVLMGSMFGNPKAGIPAWAGYTVGYRLVAKRIAGMQPVDWKAVSALPTSEFLPVDSAPTAGK